MSECIKHGNIRIELELTKEKRLRETMRIMSLELQ